MCNAVKSDTSLLAALSVWLSGSAKAFYKLHMVGASGPTDQKMRAELRAELKKEGDCKEAMDRFDMV